MPEDRIFLGQKIKKPLNDTDKLIFTVKDLTFEEEKKCEGTLFGKYTRNTQVSFQIEQNDRLKVAKKVKPARYKNADEMIKELQLGGLTDKGEQIFRNIILARNPSMKKILKKYNNIKPAKGLLLYGPPGTGKTTLARKFGEMLGCDEKHIITIKGC